MMTQHTAQGKQKSGVPPVNPVVQTIAILKASLVHLGIYAINHEEWTMVQAITEIVSGRYAHD
jgi:hypothetical protein